MHINKRIHDFSLKLSLIIFLSIFLLIHFSCQKDLKIKQVQSHTSNLNKSKKALSSQKWAINSEFTHGDIIHIESGSIIQKKFYLTHPPLKTNKRLQIQWFLNGEEKINGDFFKANRIELILKAPVSAQDHKRTIRAVIFDSDQVIADLKMNIYVNRKPIVSALMVVDEGNIKKITVQDAIDDDGDKLDYHWYIKKNDENQFQTITPEHFKKQRATEKSSIQLISDKFLPGSYNIKVEVAERWTNTVYWPKLSNPFISRTGFMKVNETIISPAQFSQSGLRNFKIFNSVVKIGNAALFKNHLREITIPQAVLFIGNDAFAYNLIKTIELPNSLQNIGNGAFAFNHIEKISIPNSIETIASHAFTSNALESVSLPNSIRSIGNYAFAFNQLHSLEIPDSVKHIGEYSFAFNQIKNLQLPSTLISIGENAFANNQLESITLPNSIKSIADGAFTLNKLKKIVIPKSIYRKLKQSSKLQAIFGLQSRFIEVV